MPFFVPPLLLERVLGEQVAPGARRCVTRNPLDDERARLSIVLDRSEIDTMLSLQKGGTYCSCIEQFSDLYIERCK